MAASFEGSDDAYDDSYDACQDQPRAAAVEELFGDYCESWEAGTRECVEDGSFSCEAYTPGHSQDVSSVGRLRGVAMQRKGFDESYYAAHDERQGEPCDDGLEKLHGCQKTNQREFS